MDRSLPHRRFLGTIGTGVADLALSIAGCLDSDDVTNDEPAVADFPPRTLRRKRRPRRSPSIHRRTVPSSSSTTTGPCRTTHRRFPSIGSSMRQRRPASSPIGSAARITGTTTGWTSNSLRNSLPPAGRSLHTIEHTAVGTFELVEDADVCVDRIYPEQIRHGYHRGKEIEITDGDRTLSRTVADYGTDDVGRYIAPDEPIDDSCAAGETIVRYPAEQMHESLGESKRELKRLAFRGRYASRPLPTSMSTHSSSSVSTTTASRTRATVRESTIPTSSTHTRCDGTTSSSSPLPTP